MKTIIFLAVIAASSLQVAAAIPHGHVHQEHIKKDLMTETITETEYVTANPTDPAVIIWVDAGGNVVSTETPTSSTMAPETTSSAAQTPTLASDAIFTAPPPTPAAVPSTSSSIAPPPPAPSTITSQAPPAAQTTSVAGDAGAKLAPTSSAGKMDSAAAGQFNGYGIGYDIIDNSGQCKSAFTVGKDFDVMTGYSIIRIYGTDCNQVAMVTTQAAQRGMKVFVGIGDPSVNIASAVQEIIRQAGSNLGVVDTIGIGNEFVGGGRGPVSVVTAALGAARAALGGVYGGNIVTVDTCGALAANPALCAASDYCAANCYAFFGDASAADAGADVQTQVRGVANANPGKAVVVTESGWAWKDPTGQNPKATADQQATALASLKVAFSGSLFIFQAFDTHYKAYGTEQYFGIYLH